MDVIIIITVLVLLTDGRTVVMNLEPYYVIKTSQYFGSQWILAYSSSEWAEISLTAKMTHSGHIILAVIGSLLKKL